MKKSSGFGTFCLTAGIVLILLSVLLLAVWQGYAYINHCRAREYVDTIFRIIPEAYSAAPEERLDNSMAAVSIEGRNIVAVLEFPKNGADFPVGIGWGDNMAFPCVYSGSMYDGSIIIGGTNQIGQFDFVKKISVGDSVYLTDMSGARFSYKVNDIRYSDHADNETLDAVSDQLTIFVKNIYAFEYIIIHCSVSGA